MSAVTDLLPAPLTERSRAFWAWWKSELEPLVPDSVRRLRKPVPRADLHISREEILIDREIEGIGERHREERPLEALDSEGWGELADLIEGARARILLAFPDVFATRLTLPAAARSRLRSAVGLQLRQHAPVDPDRLIWACRIVRGDGREIEVVVAMARADRLAAIQALFERQGMAAPTIVARVEGRDIDLAPGADGSLTPERRRMRRALALAALLLASVPLSTWTGASLMTAFEESRAQALHKQLAPRLAEDRARARDERVRQALKRVFELPSASALIENLALGLPDSAFVVRAERHYDGRFTFDAQARDREELEETLGQSRALARVHSTDAAPADGGGIQLSFRGIPR